MNEIIYANTDGGSRGNPGESAIGVVINFPNEPTIEIKEKIGISTNNVAEYTAVRTALENIKKRTCEMSVEITMDSELVQRQLTGIYKIKDENLRKIYQDIKILEKNFPSVKYHHVKREMNKIADSLVNAALDEI